MRKDKHWIRNWEMDVDSRLNQCLSATLPGTTTSPAIKIVATVNIGEQAREPISGEIFQLERFKSLFHHLDTLSTRAKQANIMSYMVYVC